MPGFCLAPRRCLAMKPRGCTQHWRDRGLPPAWPCLHHHSLPAPPLSACTAARCLHHHSACTAAHCLHRALGSSSVLPLTSRFKRGGERSGATPPGIGCPGGVFW